MKLEITVSEVKDLIKGIQEQPEHFFDMIRSDIRKSVGNNLSELNNIFLKQMLMIYKTAGFGAVLF